MPDTQGKNNFTQKILVAVGIVTVTVLILLLIRHAFHVFMLLFAASLIAILWNGAAEYLSRWLKWKQGLVLLLVIILHLGLTVLVIRLLAPSLVEQGQVIYQQIPDTIQQLQKDMQESAVGRLILQSVPQQGNVLENPEQLLKQAVSFFTTTFNIVIDIVVILALALFLSANPGLYKKGFLKLFPKHKRERTEEILDEMYYTLFKWFVGKIVDMTSIFIMTAIALWIIGVPAVLALASIAFIFSFVPNIGPVISAIPAILIGFTQGGQVALYVLLAYAGIQLFESYFITPNVQKLAIKMPPVLLLLVQLLLAIFGGVLGLFISTPLLAAFIVLIRTAYIEDVLGDKTELREAK